MKKVGKKIVLPEILLNKNVILYNNVVLFIDNQRNNFINNFINQKIDPLPQLWRNAEPIPPY